MFRKRDVAIHFVGIGGIGMSGIAEVLLNLGYPVTGSDLQESEVTRRLVTLGARIAFSHRAENVAAADVVVISSAVGPDNPEVRAARARDVPVIPRAEMLGELMRVKDGVAVAGSHGKTSTTSMLAAVFAEAGLDPTVIIGGKARALGSNARLGHGEILIAEADESDGSFRHLFPMVALVTNVDREHIDHYGSEAALRSAFVDFANQVPFYGKVVLCADDPGAQSLAPLLLKRHTSYGLCAGDYRGEVLEASASGTRLRLRIRGTPAGDLWVRMPGIHYAQNAVGAVAVADFLGVPVTTSARALANFEGVDRRFSIRGEVGGVLIVDDYGHHPTEIAATIAAARLFQRRVVVAFQPHRYSRTRDLWNEFGPALAAADRLFVTDIYAAGESPITGIDSFTLAKTCTSADRRPAEHVRRASLADVLVRAVVPGDLLLVLGAGDITRVASELVERLGAGADVSAEGPVLKGGAQ